MAATDLSPLSPPRGARVRRPARVKYVAPVGGHPICDEKDFAATNREVLRRTNTEFTTERASATRSVGYAPARKSFVPLPAATYSQLLRHIRMRCDIFASAA